MKTNEYGAPLDRNGYAPSVVQERAGLECWNCHKNAQAVKLDRHEPLGGANRAKSKRLGLWVSLCRECHEMAHLRGPSWRMEECRALELRLKQAVERAALDTYGYSIQDFIVMFGKNWL